MTPSPPPSLSTHTSRCEGPNGEPLLELGAYTLLWLDEHYPNMFKVHHCIRGPFGTDHDAIGPVDGSLTNVLPYGAYCFTPDSIVNDCFIYATDPDYFSKLDKYVKLWLEKINA